MSLLLTPLYTQSGSANAGAGDEETSPLLQYSLIGTIMFTLVVALWEGYLDFRQKKSYQKTKFPEQLEVTVSSIDAEREREKKENGDNDKKEEDKKEKDEKKKEEDNEDEASKKDKVDQNAPLLPQLQSKFTKAQSYGLDKINFGMITSTFDTTTSVIFLIVGLLPWSWDYAVKLGGEYLQWTETENEIKITLIFLAIETIFGTIVSLPFEIYSTFYIEKKHGFNKQTPSLFVTDKIKSLILTFLIGGPFIALLLNIIKWGGDYFYLYVWAFMFSFSVFMMTIVPIVIMPMFNKYEPLPDGKLRTAINDLAGKLNFPLTKLFVMDGSKRSSHSNAFMFGWMKNKRIVLFDTLLEQVHDDEILAILGHELGHWKMGHTVSNFVITQLYFGAAFYFFSLCYKSNDLYIAFGFDGMIDTESPRIVPAVIALMLFFQTLWAPVDKVLSFLLTEFSRYNEFSADKFSVDLGMSSKLQSGLCKIHLENLGAMCPDPWYSTYHYSHPPLVERLSAMMELDKKKA